VLVLVLVLLLLLLLLLVLVLVLVLVLLMVVLLVLLFVLVVVVVVVVVLLLVLVLLVLQVWPEHLAFGHHEPVVLGAQGGLGRDGPEEREVALLDLWREVASLGAVQVQALSRERGGGDGYR